LDGVDEDAQPEESYFAYVARLVGDSKSLYEIWHRSEKINLQLISLDMEAGVEHNLGAYSDLDKGADPRWEAYVTRFIDHEKLDESLVSKVPVFLPRYGTDEGAVEGALAQRGCR
jgi:hypothetical protein